MISSILLILFDDLVVRMDLTEVAFFPNQFDMHQILLLRARILLMSFEILKIII